MAESKTIGPWERIVASPTTGFKDYFDREEEYLKRNVSHWARVLEIGCGSGRSLKTLSDISEHVYGIDNDQHAVDLCLENLQDKCNVEVLYRDGERTGFPDGALDVVFIGLTYSNFGDSRDEILSETHRILCEGGKLIVSAYNEDALEARAEVYELYAPDRFEHVGNGKFVLGGGYVSEQFTGDQFRGQLEDNGFRVLHSDKTKIANIMQAWKR